MNKIIPKLGNDKKGKNGFVGWWLTGKAVVLQCPNNHRAELKLHSINIKGEVSPSALCYKNDYHENITLENWDKKYFKKENKLYIEEFYVKQN